MINAITEVTSLEPIKPVKAFNESSHLDEICALPISFASLPFTYLEKSSDRSLSARALFKSTFALSHDFSAPMLTQ